jgi:hypothetical protein
MKKILQAMDGTKAKAEVNSSDMKSFMQIVEGKGPLNRLTTAESMAVNHYTEEKRTITNPVLNVAKDAKPSMVGKYFKQVEEEFAESQTRYKDRARQLAERVTERVVSRKSQAPVAKTTSKPITAPANDLTADEMVAVLSGQKTQAQVMADREAKKAGGGVKEAGGNYGHHSNFNRHVSQSKSPPEHIMKMAKKGAKVSSKKGYRFEGTQGVDSVTMDVPLLIRLMEFAREDAADDMILHKMAERLIGMSEEGQSLSMSDYEDIVGSVDESLRTENPCWKGYKPVGTKKKNGKAVPNCVPKK